MTIKDLDAWRKYFLSLFYFTYILIICSFWDLLIIMSLVPRSVKYMSPFFPPSVWRGMRQQGRPSIHISVYTILPAATGALCARAAPDNSNTSNCFRHFAATRPDSRQQKQEDAKASKSPDTCWPTRNIAGGFYSGGGHIFDPRSGTSFKGYSGSSCRADVCWFGSN